MKIPLKNTKIVSKNPNPGIWSPDKNRVKKAKPQTLANDENGPKIYEKHKILMKKLKNPLKNTTIVSFDPNPVIWWTDENRVKKAKP